MGKNRTSGASRFDDFVSRLGEHLGHADRFEPLRAYLTGLLLPGERKSVEPMAAKIDPRRVSSRHQSMHHFVASAPWDWKPVLAVARDYALEQIERHAPVATWVVDDTGMPKKGSHSVGVARQYCGRLGKQDNCQVVVTVSMANPIMSVPCAYRLYLPEAWAQDRKRCGEAGIPDEVLFATKWEIALAAIDDLLAEDLPRAPVTADAGYGMVTAFREGLTRRRLSYALAIPSETGRQVQSLLPQSAGADGGDMQYAFVAHLVTTLCQPANWPRDCLSGTGRRCAGVRERGERCAPGSRRCECALRTGTKTSTNPGLQSGCWWTGPKGRKSPGSTGYRRFLSMPPWRVSCNWPNCAGGLTATTRR